MSGARGALLGRLRGSGGARAGAELAAATALWTAASALFSLVCIRFLGSERFGDVATMSALGLVIGIPMGSVQSLLAREVAHARASGHDDHVAHLYRRHLRVALAWSTAATVVLVLLRGPIASVTNVGSPIVCAIGLLVVPIFAGAAIINGFLQGLQRFRLLAMQIAISGVARPALAVAVFLAGFGAGGALGANFLASALGMALGAWTLRDLRPGPVRIVAPRFDRREVAILVGGTLAFASLTNLDVVLANALLSNHEGGVYAAASVAAKPILFFPAVVSTVLLPKAASRAASGQAAHRMLHLSILVTAVVAAVATLVLQFIPARLVTRVLGPEFTDATPLLGLFGLAMATMGVVNILLYYHLAYRRPGFPLLVGAAALVQAAAMVLWHPGPRQLILVTLTCGIAVIAVHEVFFKEGVLHRGGRAPATPGNA